MITNCGRCFKGGEHERAQHRDQTRGVDLGKVSLRSNLQEKKHLERWDGRQRAGFEEGKGLCVRLYVASESLLDSRAALLQ